MLPSVLALLNTSVHTYQKHFRLLFGYAAWLLLPYAAFVLTRFMPSGLGRTIAALAYIAHAVLFVWLLAVLILLSSTLLHKKPVNTMHVGAKAWKLIAPLALVILLEFLIVSGGLILLIVPGLLFLAWFTFAVFAVVLDDTHGMHALQESRKLFLGRFWRVLWKSIAGPIIFFCSYAMILGIAFFFTSPLTPSLWFEFLDHLLQIFLLPPLVLYITTLYHALIPPSADGGIKTSK